MIRAGVDMGFDGGAAVWALDFSGCVATGRTEKAAVQVLPDRVDAFVRWLVASAEAVQAPNDGHVDVVERFESYRLADGYEVNATFEDDYRPATEDDVEVALRWVDLAHERLRRAITTAGARPLSGKGRTMDELIGHVVRAERWLATRVESDQRAIAFPRDDRPVMEQLADDPAFVREHVRRAGRGDGVHARLDSKGEGWTTRKVLRRLVYHVLDHAEEVERRNAGPGEGR